MKGRGDRYNAITDINEVIASPLTSDQVLKGQLVIRRVPALRLFCLCAGLMGLAGMAFAQGAVPAVTAAWGLRDIGWLLAIALVGVIIGLLARRPPSAQPDTPATPEVPADDAAPSPPPIEAPPVMDVPGPIIVQLQELNDELAQATQRVQRYSSQREVQLQHWQRTTTEVLRRILPVLDNLDPYLADEKPEVAEVAQLAHGRLMTELSTVGVKKIEPEIGEIVDFRYHQLDPSSDGLPPYRITSVVAPGYLLLPRVPGAMDIVLKPAEVVAEGAGEEPTDLETIFDTECDLIVCTPEAEPALGILTDDTKE